MNVLITGAGGQLGRLVAASAPATVELLALDSRQLDIRDAQALCDTCNSFQPAVVINCAAYTQVDKAEAEPELALAINGQGVRNLVAATPPATRIIHMSTDFVFDGSGTRPYRPDAAVSPLGSYGRSKLAGEQALLQQAAQRSCIIRTAWLYAAEGKNFMNTMLDLMATRDALRIVDDQRGTPTSAHALAAAIWRFVDRSPLHGIYHWTDAGEATWYEFACAIQTLGLQYGLLDRKIPLVPVTTAEFPTPAKRPAYSVLDKTSTWQALGVQASPWQAELEEVIRMKRGD
jgi:dTDP-4-dehydrorhamnose reductase